MSHRNGTSEDNRIRSAAYWRLSSSEKLQLTSIIGINTDPAIGLNAEDYYWISIQAEKYDLSKQQFLHRVLMEFRKLDIQLGRVYPAQD